MAVILFLSGVYCGVALFFILDFYVIRKSNLKWRNKVTGMLDAIIKAGITPDQVEAFLKKETHETVKQ